MKLFNKKDTKETKGAEPQKTSDEQMVEALLNASYVPEDELKAAVATAQAEEISLFQYLVKSGLMTKDLIGQALAEYYSVPYADLNSNQPSQDQVLKIPEDIARKFNVVVYKETDGEVVLASDKPLQKGIKEAVQELFEKKAVSVAYSLTEDIAIALLHYQKPLDTRFSHIIEKNGRVAPEILQEIFEDAYAFKASDIHFEPRKEEVIVRFRVDGVMYEAGRLPKEYYENVLNRIKVMSRLRIDEHFAAQDGSFTYAHETGKHQFDMRTSIVPTIEGEKVVLRLLAAYVGGFAFSDLGLSEQNQEIMEKVSKKPFGMILITGPTGSGKTTTLYAALRYVQRPEINITTIEDPVEYKMSGVNQIQVNPQTNLTFAKGLRSIVRQDPDVILVGEIRDTETAEIAVNAALTGHLLFSTFHANDAATAIPRLLDMNIEPFLLASTLEVVAAQRLVRKICEHCKYSVTTKVADLEKSFSTAKKYFDDTEVTLYKGKGCTACGDTGYGGRTAIHEFILITPEMQELILTNPAAGDIWKLALKQGASPLFEDGIEKVKAGVTTIEELLRVAEPPERLYADGKKKRK